MSVCMYACMYACLSVSLMIGIIYVSIHALTLYYVCVFSTCIQIRFLSAALSESNQRLAESTARIAGNNQTYSNQAQAAMKEHETDTQNSVRMYTQQMDAAASAQMAFAREKAEEIEQVSRREREKE